MMNSQFLQGFLLQGVPLNDQGFLEKFGAVFGALPIFLHQHQIQAAALQTAPQLQAQFATPGNDHPGVRIFGREEKFHRAFDGIRFSNQINHISDHKLSLTTGNL